MKKIIFLSIVIFFTSTTFGQKKDKNPPIILPLDSLTKKVTYEAIINEEGASKDDLYVRAKEWFAVTFKSAQDVIQMDDKTAGKIIGKGLSESYYSYLMNVIKYNLYYTVSITVKDGRYRYEISSMSVKSEGGIEVSAEVAYDIYSNKKTGYALYKRIIPFIQSNSLALEESIKSTLKQPAKGIKSKDDF